ncbi:MAG TPA: hypothetical protein VD794_13710 [Flavisolibacter sp.]|nr:hypothetical protein [Flavisolibacter sp.]
MEVTAAVLYDGALAHYDVNIEKEGVCKARLSSYKGNNGQRPPEHLTLRKEGRRWVSSEGNVNLAEDIGYAVELKVPREVMETVSRRRNGAHPAG